MDEPIHIMFETTQRCNNNCIYCYNVWKENPDYPKGELSLSEVRNLFDKLTDEVNLKSVTLTGGEPLLRGDIEGVASHLVSRGIELSLATNGTLIDGKKSESLVDSGLRSFEIPILSTNRSVHNSLSGNTAYDRACEAITNLKAHDVAVTVVFVATKKNIGHFDDVAELAFALGADSIMIDRFLPGGEGKKHASELEPGNEELADLVAKANVAARRFKLDISLGIPLPSGLVNPGNFKNLRFGACGAGKGKWAVDSLGNLRLCEQEPHILGNLLNSRFSELGNRSPLPCRCISCGEVCR
jgi:MoaA/NifB/PqqE/SkfB family radical SAM enzyme